MENFKDKKRIFIIAAVVLTVVVCFALAETGIRIYHLTSDRQRFIWLPDEFLGYVHSGNNQFQHHFTEQERITVDHRTNAFGMIGAEITVDKNPGTYRILILGDSFTEAIQVEDNANFSARLEQQFNNLPDRKHKKTEVLNAGVSGYSPLNYYLNFKRQWAALDPDLVLVQIFANDVFEDNTARAKSLLDENGLPLKTGRYFEEKYFDHPPVIAKNFNSDPLSYSLGRFLIEKSRFIEYMYVKIYNAKKSSKFNQKMIREDQYGTGYQFFILDPTHVLSRDEEFRVKAWGYTQKYLLALKKEVEAQEANMMLFYLPMEPQLELDQYGRHVSLYISKKQGTYFNDLLDKFSRENNIRYLDLLDDFEQNKHRGLYLSKDGHLTQAGHKVVADALFRSITRDKLLAKGLRVNE